MKRLLLALVFSSIFFIPGLSLLAQAPAGIHYQAILRDNGQILVNQNVTIEFSVLDGVIEVYRESQALSTGPQGLINAVIGEGVPLSGNFDGIDWSQGSYSLVTRGDIGSGMVDFGQSGFASVPYSLFADRATRADSVSLEGLLDVEVSAKNPGDVLRWNGLAWEPSTDEVDDADSNPANELQTLSFTAPDQLMLSQGGGQVQLPIPTPYVGGAGITISDSMIVNSGDTDASDDLLIGASATGDLSGSYPAPQVTAIRGLPVAANAPQSGNILKWNGTSWMPANDEDSGGDITAVSVGTGLTGGGTGGSLTISANTLSPLWNANRLQGNLVAGTLPSNGHVLKWNGISWAPAPDEEGVSPWSSSGTNVYISSGKVGIGTSSPLSALDLSFSSSSTSNGFRMNNNGSGDVLIRLAIGGASKYSIGVDNSDADKLKIGTGASVSSNALLTLDNSGKLGIGTESPASTLAVDGDFRLQTSGTMKIYGFDSNGSGVLRTYGPNSNYNVMLTHLASFPNNAYVAAYDGSGAIQAGIYVNSSGQGIVFGDTKSFRMQHPTREGKEIWYASLEGPEAGAYLRGTAELVHGRATIPFPDHWKHVAAEDGMTVILTPLSLDSRGLAVISKSLRGLEVGELMSGTGNYEFDWEVKAVRKGHEGFQVVRDASEVLPAAHR